MVSISLCAACSSSPELGIDLRSDLSPGVEVDSVVVTVDGVAGAPRSLDRALDLVRGVRIHETTLPAGRHDITVALRDDGATVLSRDYVLRLEGSLIMIAVLTRDCRGVMCPGSSGSAAETACLAGRCVDPRCVMVGDPECPPDLDPCAETECTAVVACATASCTAGVCFQSSACTAGSHCSFEAEMCIPDETMADAGSGDAGIDAGLDAGAMDAATDGGDAGTGLTCATRCPDGCPAIEYDVEILTDAAIARPLFVDLDGDGELDVVATSGRNAVSWSSASGDLTFAGNLGVSAARPLGPIAAANFDDDGLTDLFVLHQDCLEAHLSAGGWRGAAGSVCDSLTYRAPMAVGDLDVDGLVDDVLVGSPGGLTPFLTDFSAGDVLFAASFEIPVGGVEAIGLGDVDGNGTLDAVVARDADLLTLVAGGGTFSLGATVPYTGTAQNVVVTRLFCDVLPSTLVDDETGGVLVVRNDGSGLTTRLPGSASAGIVVADLDGDSVADVLALEPGIGVRVFRADEGGMLVDQGVIPAPAVLSGLVRAEDGRVVAAGGEGELVVLTPR